MERTYKKIEIVGISETSFGDATQNAVAKACQSLRHADRLVRFKKVSKPGRPSYPKANSTKLEAFALEIVNLSYLKKRRRKTSKSFRSRCARRYGRLSGNESLQRVGQIQSANVFYEAIDMSL